jgi:hypothetical protein
LIEEVILLERLSYFKPEYHAHFVSAAEEAEDVVGLRDVGITLAHQQLMTCHGEVVCFVRAIAVQIVHTAVSAASHLAHAVFVQHVSKFVVLLLSFNLVEILDCIPRGTQLDQDNTGFFDCDVPIVLQVEYLLPYRKRNELAIFLKELQVF